MEIEKFIKKLDTISREYNYEPSYREHGIVLSRKGTLLTVNIEFPGDNAAIYLYARTTSWDADGDRTDLNDILSTLPAIFLRLNDINISSTLLDVEHPLGQGEDGGIRAVELYARYIVFTQPYVDGLLPRSKESLNTINNILNVITEYEFSLSYFIESNDQQEPGCLYEDDNLKSWANLISKSLGENLDSDSIIYNLRVNPNWYYFRSIEFKISIIFAPKTAFMLQSLFEKSSAFKILDSDDFKFYKSEHTYNAYNKNNENQLKKILTRLEGDDSNACLIPIENRLILISQQHVFFYECECDRKVYAHGKEIVIARRKKEQNFLFNGKTYVWSKKINGGRFEELTRELLVRRGAIQVRNTSITNEPDANADLVCTWDTASLSDMPQINDVSPVQRRKIVVQCKGWAKNIGKNDIPSIRDTLDRFDADGMLIVVSRSITRSLFDHFEALKRKGVWADYWDRPQIEDFLDENPDILMKYQDIVRYAEDT